MSVSSFPKKTDTKPKEKNTKNTTPCPVCGGTIKPGYDTQIGRVFVCENYPKNCTYIVRKEK